MNLSNTKLIEVVNFYKLNGRQATLDVYGFNDETLNRYLRAAREKSLETISRTDLLKQIGESFSNKELQAIAKGGRILPGVSKVPVIDFEGEEVSFCLSGDWHVGSAYFDEDYIYKMYEECDKKDVDFICMGGDLVEGMSNRPGHIYELTHLGYSAQKEYAQELLSQSPRKMYLIDGNHDRWYIKNSGAYIVKEICDELNHKFEEDRFTFLGHDEGDISLNGLATMKLWHGEDGNSYAISYRVQKIIESITGGEKPNILVCHHVHKVNYIFSRHIHAISPGSIQRQSKWMRGKRIEAHPAFVIAKAVVNDTGVASFTFTLYPFYA